MAQQTLGSTKLTDVLLIPPLQSSDAAAFPVLLFDESAVEDVVMMFAAPAATTSGVNQAVVLKLVSLRA